jgi:elongation factor Tu
VRVRLELWTKEQGGRHTPAMTGYRPSFRAATEGHGDVDLGIAEVTMSDDHPMLVPGESVDVEITPADVAAWENVSVGLVLGAFEGATRVGAATVLER